jgi:hypothetical protein
MENGKWEDRNLTASARPVSVWQGREIGNAEIGLENLTTSARPVSVYTKRKRI